MANTIVARGFVEKVIPTRRWRHRSGRTASLYGAVPWSGAAGDRREDWTLEDAGWTWQNRNGTIGLGRQPAATYEEAVSVMERVNSR